MTDTVKGLGDNREGHPDQGRSLCKGTGVYSEEACCKV